MNLKMYLFLIFDDAKIRTLFELAKFIFKF